MPGRAYCRRRCVVPDSDGVHSKASRLRSCELSFGRASPGSFAERKCAGLHPPQGQDAGTERSVICTAPERPRFDAAYHIPHSLFRCSDHSEDYQCGCIGLSAHVHIIGPDFSSRQAGHCASRCDAWPEGALNTVRSRIATLTPREREIFELVIRGETNKPAAKSLGCAVRTIKAHRHRMMEKMQVRRCPNSCLGRAGRRYVGQPTSAFTGLTKTREDADHERTST